AQEKPAKGAGKDEKQRVDIRGLGAHRRTVAQLDEHGIVLEHDPLGLQMAKLAELILVARLETLRPLHDVAETARLGEDARELALRLRDLRLKRALALLVARVRLVDELLVRGVRIGLIR